MCGISGFYSKNLSKYNNVILRMNSAVSHRGPDFSSQWEDNNFGIALGHQRLSILDLSNAGNQPMISDNQAGLLLRTMAKYIIIKDIRKEINILNPNIKWKSNSDTETLLESIETFGIKKALQKTVGMFAFAIWDKKLFTDFSERSYG